MQSVPQTDWLKYFSSLIGVKVDKNEEIIVTVPEFVTKVDRMLATENKRTIANYMVWRIVLQSVSSLNKPFRDAYFKYQRWFCIANQNDKLLSNTLFVYFKLKFLFSLEWSTATVRNRRVGTPVSVEYRVNHLSFTKIAYTNSNESIPLMILDWMGMAVSSLYVKHYFDPESKKQAVTLVDYLLKEFQKILKNIDWMDKSTQKRAIEKAEAFKTYM